MRYMQKNIGLDSSVANVCTCKEKTTTKMKTNGEKPEELEVEAMRRFVH